MLRRPVGKAGNANGYTFNEVLVAISVIMIGVLGYAAGTVTVMRGNVVSRDHTVAVNLAQDKLEELKSRKDWPDVNNCPHGGNREISAHGLSGGLYNRCWTITDSPLGANLRQISVTVTWPNSDNRQVTLTTLVFSG